MFICNQLQFCKTIRILSIFVDNEILIFSIVFNYGKLLKNSIDTM